MAKRDDYADLVAQAGKAVERVKDPDLKRIAFQKILDDLLSSGGPAPQKARVANRASHKAAKTKRAGGPRAYIDELVEDGFFKKPTTIAQVKAELENRGHHIPLTSLSGPLQRLCQDKKLRRQKVKASGNKQTFAYSDW